MANDGVANFNIMRDMVLNTTERVRLIQKQARRLILQDKFNQKTDSNSNGIPKGKHCNHTHPEVSDQQLMKNEQLMGLTHYHLGG